MPHFDFRSFLGLRVPPQHVGAVNRLFVPLTMSVKGPTETRARVAV